MLGPGLRDDDVYDAQMSWWRAGLRRIMLKNLKTESDWIGALQVRPPDCHDLAFLLTYRFGASLAKLRAIQS